MDMLPSNYRSGELSNDEEIVLLPTNDLDEKYILLYFASHSDALSQEFTPWLVKAYNILKKKRQDFEVRVVLQMCCLFYSEDDLRFSRCFILKFGSTNFRYLS